MGSLRHVWVFCYLLVFCYWWYGMTLVGHAAYKQDSFSDSIMLYIDIYRLKLSGSRSPIDAPMQGQRSAVNH